MSAVEQAPEVDETPDQTTEHDGATLNEPLQVEVRRNGLVSALLGATASAVSIAYLWRAAESGHVLDWVLCAALGVFAVVFLHSLLDARTPLLVADELGVRIRLGTTWRGLPWEGIERVVVQPRRGLARDGSLVVQMNNVARAIEGLEGRARRHAVLNRKAYGGALAVPLGLSTRHEGSDDDLSNRIATLSQGRAEVVTLLLPPKPSPAEEPQEGPADTSPADGPAPLDTEATTRDADEVSSEPGIEPDVRSAPLEGPGDDQGEQHPRTHRRWLRRGARPGTAAEGHEPHADTDTDTVHDPDDVAAAEPGAAPVPVAELPVQRRDEPAPTSVRPAEARAVPLRDHGADETVTIRIDEVPRSTRAGDAVNSMREAVNPVGRNESRVRAIAKLGEPVAPLVIDDYKPEPAYDPAIGPELAASRTRVGLSVDELADRTRIRPHVIESIEVDDFAPCGGDFYARGHIRTLSRVLGKDPVPLLEIYENRYAHAPVNARKVFEAELATGMGGQMTRPYGGPNWTGLVAAVLVLVLVWAAVRLFAGDGGELLEEPPPVVDGSAGLSSYYPEPGTPSGSGPVAAVLTAEGTATAVEVRDAGNNLVFEGELGVGEIKRLRVVPPVAVTADDGGAVSVRVGAQDHGVLGEDGSPATQTFERAG
jgi:cytoskeleton protein RodZ